MKIANADKLIHHFEHTVMVKNFTVPEIVTIINNFSVDIDEECQIVFPRGIHQIKVTQIFKNIFKFKIGIAHQDTKPEWSGIFDVPLSEEQISEVHEND